MRSPEIPRATASSSTLEVMRIFLAGGSGVIGRRLIPLLVEAGHTVGAMTRSADKADSLTELGAEPIVCDVFDREALAAAVAEFEPDVVLHELTDLPDDVAELAAGTANNDRIRIEGTLNLSAAIKGHDGVRLIGQSIAWALPAGRGADAVASLEATILGNDGVVLRYGQFYGPDTYYPDELPSEPRVQIDTAAARTVEALTAPAGVITITD